MEVELVNDGPVTFVLDEGPPGGPGPSGNPRRKPSGYSRLGMESRVRSPRGSRP
jgi:hypothetical protein